MPTSTRKKQGKSMEELEKSKKQTKILKCTFLIILLIDIMFFAIVFIKELQRPSAPPPPIALENIAVKVFNSSFEKYTGKQKGQVIKTLIIEINASNLKVNEHQIQIVGITEISEISNNEYYNVKTEYSDSGYINKIIIENSEE